MDEEILEETETINYDVMRYDLDEQGYIHQIYFGCSSGSCIAYEGKIPDGYDNLEEWYEDNFETIRAWKIFDGNLVLDTNKENEILNRCETETEENTHATHKWVNDKLKNINEIFDDELSATADGSSLFLITDAKEADVASLKIIPNGTIRNNIKVHVTNENILENKGVNETKGGITFTVNEDRTITLNGTSTEDIEYTINGSLANTDTIFFLKSNENYMKCGFPDNTTLGLYSYDGEELELVSEGGNETIIFNDGTKNITYVVLKIKSGTTFTDTKIYPMLTIGKYQEKDYVQYKGNDLTNINLPVGYAFYDDDYVLIERDSLTIKIHDDTTLYPSDTLYPDDELFPSYYEQVEFFETTKQLTMFDGLTIIQCDQDVNFEIKYFSKDYLNKQFSIIENRENEIELSVGNKVGKDEVIASINMSTETDEGGSGLKLKADKIKLEGYTTINNGFSVDEQGNATMNDFVANNGTMNNATITGGHINGAYLNLSDAGGYQAGITIINENSVADGRCLLSSNMFELDGNGHLIFISTDSLFFESPGTEFVNFDGKFKIYNDGNASLSGSLTQGSLEELKKNFEKFDGGLELIKNADVYKYNYKTEEDNCKKHIGLVIGDKYKTPTEILNDENTGVDTYSMVSVCFNAIKQLNSKIEQLENRIKELEGDK